MTREVRYYCDRCGKELCWCDYVGKRIRARLLGRSFTICGACDNDFYYWLHKTGVYKDD